MDPNANLAYIRDLLEEWERNGSQLAANDWNTLAELISALDGWMSNGGFTPTAWKRGERP